MCAPNPKSVAFPSHFTASIISIVAIHYAGTHREFVSDCVFLVLRRFLLFAQGYIWWRWKSGDTHNAAPAACGGLWVVDRFSWLLTSIYPTRLLWWHTVNDPQPRAGATLCVLFDNFLCFSCEGKLEIWVSTLSISNMVIICAMLVDHGCATLKIDWHSHALGEMFFGADAWLQKSIWRMLYIYARHTHTHTGISRATWYCVNIYN